MTACGFLVFTLFDEIAGRLVLEDGENDDEAGEDDVEAGRDFLDDCQRLIGIRIAYVPAYPSLVCVITHVHLTAVIGEIGQDNTQVDEAREDAGAETADGRGSLGAYLVL